MHRRKKVLELLNGLVFGLTIIGANMIAWFNINIPLGFQMLITAFLAIVYVCVAYEKTSDRIHSFDEQSPKFTKFFQKWYSQDGLLSIFCTDLDWLDNQQSAGIVYELERKGTNLKLYLRKPAGRIVERLCKSGAKAYEIKDSVRTQHRLSLLDQDGIKRIIVRNKDMESAKIVFIETDEMREPYLIGMTEDLLDDCFEKEVVL